MEVYDFIKLGVPKRLRKKLNINEGQAPPVSLSNIIDLDKVSLTFYLCAQLFYVIEFLFL